MTICVSVLGMMDTIDSHHSAPYQKHPNMDAPKALSADDYESISHWSYLAILESLQHKDYEAVRGQEVWDWFSETLELTSSQVDTCLERLRALGLIYLDSRGKPKRSALPLKVKPRNRAEKTFSLYFKSCKRLAARGLFYLFGKFGGQ